MSADGYNPLRWNCKLQGCFNKVCRPKIEEFAHCFPGKINFGDMDVFPAEINGNLLMLEWKEKPIPIPMGQFLMYERITSGKTVCVLCLAGDARSMFVTHRGWFCDGKWIDWKPCDYELACEGIKKWVCFANKHRAIWNSKAA